MHRAMTAYWSDFRRDLASLIAIRSVAAPGGTVPGQPYGEACAQALDWILSRAREMGLRVENAEGYAGHAEWGEGEEYCAVLAHLDVVPAGFGWTASPFSLDERAGCLYGRGTADDKGAALAALYCLWRLKENGVVGKRKIRVIFGCGEECGMEDMKHYFAREPLPVFAFTPDSDYTVCNREKGILQIKYSGPGETDGVVSEFCAGAAVNAVPDCAQATLCCDPEEWRRLREKSGESSPVRWELEDGEDGLRITAYGKASHAMSPQEGVNAATHLIDLLYRVFGERIGKTLTMLKETVERETTGETLGIACVDEPSGALTLNLGTVTVNRRCGVFSMDIRYPVTADGAEILDVLKREAARRKMELSLIHHLPPIYLPPDSPLIRLLVDTYEEVSGEKARIYATGGGTYARTLGGRGVAFGPIFPEQGDPAMHKPDEHIVIDRFQTHMEICYEAMRRMMRYE